MLRRGRGERGATLVEFALTVPLFVAMILFLVTGGLAYNQKLDLLHAVREGARYGATVPQNQVFVSGTWATNVRDIVVDRSNGDLTAAQVCVALVSQSPGVVVGGSSQASYTTQASGLPCYDDGNRDSGTRIQISASRPAQLEALTFTRSLTLTAKATARYEG
jgi:Flp pilus assembly protein TadG